MSASNAFETDQLKHIFQNTAITLIGDAAGVLPSAGAGSLYIGLCTADPGEAGTQSTNEATYTGYARVAVARTSAAWGVTNGVASNLAVITFPACTGGSNTITHFSIGTSLSGTGYLLYKGALTGSLAVSNLIEPTFPASAITVTLD